MKRYFQQSDALGPREYIAFVALSPQEPWASVAAVKISVDDAQAQFCCEYHARRWMWARCIASLRRRHDGAKVVANRAIQQARLRALRHEGLARLPKWNPNWTNLAPQALNKRPPL